MKNTLTHLVMRLITKIVIYFFRTFKTFLRGSGKFALFHVITSCVFLEKLHLQHLPPMNSILVR